MTMTGKLLILTGAPESHRLDWEASGLLSTFQPAIAQFALLRPAGSRRTGPRVVSSEGEPQEEETVFDLAVWRSLPLTRTHIRTGFSQQHDLHFVGAFPTSADFLTLASISFTFSQGLGGLGQDAVDVGEDEDSSRLLTEFYEHSLALHHDLVSSQIVPGGPQSQQQQHHHQQHQQPSQNATSSEVGSEETTTTTTSFVSDTNSNSRSFTSDEGRSSPTTDAPGDGTTVVKTPLTLARAGAADHLSDLEDIPPAAYLVSIQPSTMTVTLIVGVISIAAPRTVETRYGATKTLVEVLVGDETKSGFSVTFWLSEDEQGAVAGGGGGGGGAAAAAALAGLRSQDVVLMRNVALNVFRKQVYGGSLRRGMTRVHLLYRGGGAAGGGGGKGEGYYSHADLAKAGRGGRQERHPQLEKTRRVRDWVLRFVGVGVGTEGPRTKRTRKGKERVVARRWNQPPPLDSQ